MSFAEFIHAFVAGVGLEVEEDELDKMQKYTQLLGAETVASLKVIFDRYGGNTAAKIGVATRQLPVMLRALGRHPSPQVSIIGLHGFIFIQNFVRSLF